MIGNVFGRYRVTHRLGEGGMAEVWAAVHEVSEREAVVKMLRPEMSAKEQLLKRFLQEAKAAARIDDLGIVKVIDVGYALDGRAYLILERLSGQTLGERLHERGTLSLDEATCLMRQLARTMGVAHARDIIHRDLKPDNLFLVPDPEVAGGERIKGQMIHRSTRRPSSIGLPRVMAVPAKKAVSLWWTAWSFASARTQSNASGQPGLQLRLYS